MHRPISVVVADDDAAVVELLAAAFDREPDFELIGRAGDALAAVEVVCRCRPDVAVLDVRMPHGGAVRVARELAELAPEVAIVVLSGHSDVATVRQMLASGIDGYVVKGAALAELLEMLRSVVGRRSDRPPGLGGAIPRSRLTRVLVAAADPARLALLADAVLADPELELAGLAQSPFHALTLAAQEQPHVILVDPELPGGGGMRTIDELQLTAPSARVLRLDDALDLTQEGTRRNIRAAVHPTTPLDDLVPPPAGADEETAGIIRAILDQGALETVFQPIVSLGDSRTAGFEALTRFPTWPRRSTQVFFVEALRLGLGLELEVAALSRACAHLSSIDADCWLSLNVAPQHLLSDRVTDVLAGAPAGRLVIELTEHAAVPDYDVLIRRLTELRQAGVRIAVDDTGAGFSSLRHILRLGPEFIKLDMGLCRGIADDPARAAMARALVAFAGETGSAVVAEGIENQRDLEALRGLGVDLGQGYHLGRPAPLPAKPEPSRRAPARGGRTQGEAGE